MNYIILLSFSQTVMKHLQLSTLQMLQINTEKSINKKYIFVLLYTFITLCFVVLSWQ